MSGSTWEYVSMVCVMVEGRTNGEGTYKKCKDGR